MEPNACDYFKTLTHDEQNEILRMILSEGGLTRLMSVVLDAGEVGDWDLWLDRVSYYHFLPSVKEKVE